MSRYSEAAKISKKSKVYPFAKIVHSEDNFFLGDFSQIDDFVFIYAGKLCKIGRFVHIASFVSVIGGGEFLMEDFSGLSAGCRIITGSDDFAGGYLTNPTVPCRFTNVRTSRVTIARHSIIGTNVIIFPGISIGEGAAIGAGTIVKQDIEPWSICVGSAGKIKKIGERDREAILKKELQLMQELDC